MNYLKEMTAHFILVGIKKTTNKRRK